MNVSFAPHRPAGAYALALPVWSEDMLSDRLASLGEPARTVAARAAESQRFERELGAVAETFVQDDDQVRRLLLVGLGANRDEPALCERIGGTLAGRLLISGETRLAIDVTGLGLSAEAAARIGFAAAARSWRYDNYRTKLGRKQKPTLEEVVIVGADMGAEDAWKTKAALLDGLSFTRELVTEPANIIYPESFVARARKRLEPLGVEIEVLDEKKMAELGFGALLGVGQGSARPPRLLVMRWNGGGQAKPVVFVGKGITFDTGGINRKPGNAMTMMFTDMAGGAAVLAAIRAVAEAKVPVQVSALVPAAENALSGSSYRPGDVVRHVGGRTSEIGNTDAEGRIVLADALAYAAARLRPSALVDIATLTGAMKIALGVGTGGLFATSDDLAAGLLAAGEATG
ncbi:MAG TPA: M17 family peptidase N-terminal domain-containing protein, partial [Allosphingosinicella sp.]